jgi:diguanylate cyclase (GGDEF)-like protein/PAS domain S-box-containing protein
MVLLVSSSSTESALGGAATKAGSLGDRIEAMLESMTDAFYMLDAEWRFIYVNRKAEQILARSRSDLLGKVIWDEFPDASATPFRQEFQRAVGENRAVSFEANYAPLDKWGELRAFPSDQGLAVYFTDVTERRRREAALRDSEQRFKIVARATTDAIWDWGLDADSVWWNENIESLSGYRPDEIGPGWWTSRIHPDDRDRVLNGVAAALAGSDENWTDEYRFIRKDGSAAFVLDRGFILRDSGGRPVRMVGSLTDLSDRKRAELERDRLDKERLLLLESTGEGIWGVDQDGLCTFINRAASQMLGYSAQEALGKNMHQLVHARHADGSPFPASECLIARSFRQGTKSFVSDDVFWRQDGVALPVEYASYPILDAGRVTGSVVTFRDISERKAAESEIRHLAFFDSLTQLPNRRLLMDRLERAVAGCAAGARGGALLFIDLDNFKALNDTYGHDQGDLLLRLVAQRLASCVHGTDTVARLGGDEFVVVLENLGATPTEAALQAKAVAERLLAVLREPYRLDTHEYLGTPSVGVTLFGNAGDDVRELLRRADHAMYRAKGAGRNTVRFFDPEMHAAMVARAAMEADLRLAVQGDQLVLHFQPQADMGGRIQGAEALVRWRHPTRGTVPPGQFIRLAEEVGLILPIGQWVLETACRQLAQWALRPETAALSLAVNVSATQLGHPGFVCHVLDTLRQTGARADRLKLELTESLLVENVDETIKKMATLKAAGVGFSLDDFGTGYSSLAYLKRLPLDQLKIDRSFVNDAQNDHNAAVIIRAIITLGQSLGLEVIAEGVETEQQLAFLMHNRCHGYQGFYFSPPLPLERFEVLLHDRAGQRGDGLNPTRRLKNE